MNRKIKRLFIFMIIVSTAVIVNYTRASDKNPVEANGDCSECLTDAEYLSYFSQQNPAAWSQLIRRLQD